MFSQTEICSCKEDFKQIKIRELSDWDQIGGASIPLINGAIDENNLSSFVSGTASEVLIWKEEQEKIASPSVCVHK